jgi:tetratricopeptide (TPR) repeat protein
VPRFNRLELPDDPSPIPQPDKTENGNTLEKQGKKEKRYKSSVSDWMFEAVGYRRLGLYESALRSYGRALECERSHVAAWVGQAQMLVLLNEPRQAEMWTISGLKVFPNNPELLAVRAQALCRLGNQHEALQFSDAAIQGDGNSAYRWAVRGELMTAAKSSTAEHCFDSAEQIDPDWLVRIENANILRFYNLSLKALGRAGTAVKAAPESPFAWMVKGICEYQAGFNNEAKKSLETALQLNPDLKEIKYWLALAENGVSLFQRIRRFFLRW